MSISLKIRYLKIGLINTAIGLSIYPVVYLIFSPHLLDYFQALILSYLISISIAYYNMKKSVFMTKGDVMGEIIRFSIFHLLIFLLNIVILPIMVEDFEIPPIIAQSIFSVIIIIGGYLWHSNITFTSNKHHERN